MVRKPTISDLLAIRDGEQSDPELMAEVHGDPAAQATLAELDRLKAELRTLPPVAPDATVWDAIQERTGQHRPWLQRFPLATAASVFLAAALTIMLWDPTSVPAPVPAGPQVSDPVAQLMLRSRNLESELFTRAAAPDLPGDSGERALLYGIADVDAQLNALYEAEPANPVERERLWRQRVVLLESLADVQRGQAVLQPAVY
jgi:hypothetical protein